MRLRPAVGYRHRPSLRHVPSIQCELGAAGASRTDDKICARQYVRVITLHLLPTCEMVLYAFDVWELPSDEACQLLSLAKANRHRAQLVAPNICPAEAIRIDKG